MLYVCYQDVRILMYGLGMMDVLNQPCVPGSGEAIAPLRPMHRFMHDNPIRCGFPQPHNAHFEAATYSSFLNLLTTKLYSCLFLK